MAVGVVMTSRGPIVPSPLWRRYKCCFCFYDDESIVQMLSLCEYLRNTAIDSSKDADVCSAAIFLALYAVGCNFVRRPVAGTRAPRLSRRWGFVLDSWPRPMPKCKIIDRRECTRASAAVLSAMSLRRRQL
jgi:hypothetical protein